MADVSKAKRARLRFIDLFAGCGGLASGFVQSGHFTPVGACESDPDAAETYRRNVDKAIFDRLIERVPSSEWPRADVLIGGPPCQGFSQLGRRDPFDERNRLWIHYARVLRACGADVFVMENVPQLLRSPQFQLFTQAVARRGFDVRAEVLNAAEYGVPQMRRRAIVVGSRIGTPSLPTKTHGPNASGGATFVDVRTAFRGLSSAPDGYNWHNARPGIRPTSHIRYQAVPPSGGNRFQMQENLAARGLNNLVPRCWRAKPSGTTDVFGRMWWDRPAPTIRTEFYKPEKGRYLHPEEHRPITVREAARLQSFSDDFEFPSEQSMVSVARQIGNAVPPALARALGLAIFEHFANTKRVAA